MKRVELSLNWFGMPTPDGRCFTVVKHQCDCHDVMYAQLETILLQKI